MKTKILILLLFPLILFGKIQTTYLITQGSGYTRAKAIRDALVEAVKQTKGVALSAKRTYIKSIQELGISVDGDSTHAVAISENSSKLISEATKGFIRNYRVIDAHKDGNEWIVKIRIKMYRYKTPGLNPKRRRTLAVLPFEYKRSYDVDGIIIGGRELSRRVTQSIVNKITQTRKFSVLDRQNSKYYNFEKNFLLSGNSNVSELSRLGKRFGADYFIIGQILDFGANKKISSNYYTGEIRSKNLGFATISYRILAIDTQQIKWSDTIDIDFIIPKTRRVESLLVKAGDKIAQVMADQIIFNIYPPKIIKKSGHKVIINMGGNFLHKNDLFKVYALGEKLYDPYSKEFLGREEEEIGKIKITSVRPKISYGIVISGVATRGALIRKDKKANADQKKDETPDGQKDSMFDMMFSK